MGESAIGELAISVRNVSKCYQAFDNQNSRLLHAVWPSYKTGMQEIWALREINFEINRGEAVAIIGRNGSGKSTLLEIITGTLTPTSGEVVVNGRVSALLELGSGFNPEYTGRNNVILNGLLLGLTREEIIERFDEIEAFSEIGSAIDRPVKTYSSGMMLRLAFAVQVLCEPNVLIIDEALSVGDFFFQQKCLKYIRKLCDKGTTLLFVSHDTGTIRDLCSRVIYLKQGKMLFDGPAGDGIPLFFKEHSHVPAIQINRDSSLNNDNAISRLKFDAFKQEAIWVNDENAVTFNKEGSLLAIALYDENGYVATHFKMGSTIRVTVAYIHHGAYDNHVAVGLVNKYGHISTLTGSSQLGVRPPENVAGGSLVFFDLWLTLMLEVGNYSMIVTLGYDIGINLGERLEQSPAIGPIQITWDYAAEKAPFIGQCGLPARAVFREDA